MGDQYDSEYTINSDMSGDEEERSLLGPSKEGKAPQDRLFAVFFIFGFLGLASLLPWNFFITAKTYFDYKFRNTTTSNGSSFYDKDYPTHLQTTFESYLSIVSNGSNMVLMMLTTLLIRWVSVKTRIVGSSFLITAIFIATTVMVRVNTDSWQDKFFMFTLIMVAFMSGSQSVLTGSILGLSATFPVIYAQSAMIGQAAGGTFSAVASILTLWTGGDPITSAFIYFLIASASTVLALISYLCLHFLPFAKFYMIKKETQLKDLSTEIQVQRPDESKVKFLWTVFKKIWLYCVSVLLVFLVTLSIFPAVCSNIRSVNSRNEWTDTYFTPVVCFLLFNVGDLLGRLATFLCKFPGRNRPVILLVLTCLRIGFIPLLMLCNAQPRSHLNMVFDHDAWPIAFISLMGLSNGYLGTLCMSFGPVHVKSDEAEGAGTLLALSMTIGLAGGSFLSMPLLDAL